MKKLIKWFELNLGWLFVNGRKQAEWAEHLRTKYGTVQEQDNKPKVQPRKKEL